MKIIIGNEAILLRKKYITSFIDTNSTYYNQKIKKQVMFSDGICYEGYLWDCLRNKFMMSEKACVQYIQNIEKLYVFWDIHSKDRIFIQNYWKYPKNAVLEIGSKEFSQKIHTFPEDIYIVDETFEWSVIFTHETNLNEERYCLFAYL